MAKVKQPYREARVVPWLGHILVEPGAVVTVPDDKLAGFLEAGWEPADPATKRAGKQLLDAGTITVLAGVTDQEPVQAPAEAPAAASTESTEG